MNTTLTNEALSAEVASRLFGWKPETQPEHYWFKTTDSEAIAAAIWGTVGGYSGPAFASDHNAAMRLVVPEMRKRGYVWFDCGIDKLGVAWAKFTTSLNPWGGIRGYSDGEEIPRAICLAALAALDAEGETK